MPFTPIADTAKVELIGHQTGSPNPIVNVLHVRLSNANQDLAHLNAIVTAFDTALSAHTNVWPDDFTWDEIVATGLATATSPQVATAVAIAGVQAHNAVPGLAYLTKMTTGTRGRSFRGRIYWGPVVITALADELGSINATFIGIVDGLTSAIATALGALTPPAPLVVASRVLGTSAEVTSAHCEGSVAFQRRRSGR